MKHRTATKIAWRSKLPEARQCRPQEDAGALPKRPCHRQARQALQGLRLDVPVS